MASISTPPLSPPRRRRLLSRTLGGIALCIVAFAVVGFAWLRTSLPPRVATVAVEGLSAPVEVLVDRHGVPHIFAESAEDGAAALGAVHAQDRLWQMEGMRRVGAGRLAEIFGPGALASDSHVRALGLYSLAERQVDRLSPPARRTLEAYARGVNAWLAIRSGAPPIEFLLIGHDPEPWRPADSLLWARLMAMTLATNHREEIIRARLAARLDLDRVLALWPPVPADSPVTLGIPGLPNDDDAVAGEGGGVDGGSNGWVVGGAWTESGKPLLANDPHLSLKVPIQWYLARIVTPELTVVGATAPGVPFLVFGHNGTIAWGITNTGTDVEDIVVEKLDAGDGSAYATPTGAQPFEVREEVIAVGGGAPSRETVRLSRHGPVIYAEDVPDLIAYVNAFDDTSADDATVVGTLRATYLRDDDATPEAMFRLNRARSWPEFIAALRSFHSPQVNFLYADTGGTVGFAAPGRVPMRARGDGRLPALGWTGAGGWAGFIPFEDLPRANGGRDAAFINANNRIVDAAYPWHLSDLWDPGYRARRIEQLLEKDRGRHSVKTFTAAQMDTLSLMARALKPALLAALPDHARFRDFRARLAGWDGEMAGERAEPLIFLAWLRALNRALYADETGPEFPRLWAYRPVFLAHVLGEDRSWCDDVTTEALESCPELVAAALDAALAELRKAYGGDVDAWRWGDAHRAWFASPLTGRLPALAAWLGLAVPTAGGSYTVNRGGSPTAHPLHPYRNIHAAGYRAVYDLADLDRSRFVIATGQSGNPLSRHYADMVPLWRDGGGITLARDRATLQRQATRRLILTPAEKDAKP